LALWTLPIVYSCKSFKEKARRRAVGNATTHEWNISQEGLSLKRIFWSMVIRQLHNSAEIGRTRFREILCLPARHTPVGPALAGKAALLTLHMHRMHWPLPG
jgi:hypothetical protein